VKVKVRKPWHTKKWREKRAEFIKGKSCEWCGSHEGPFTIHHPQERNTLPDEEYISFDGTIVLCKRCHFATHNGMHLCPKCKKKYVRNRFYVCFDCLSSETKKKIAEWKLEIEYWEKEDPRFHEDLDLE